MKISVIGAGNVGGLTAMRLAEEGLGEVLLFDIVKGLAQGKILDLEDCQAVTRRNFNICATDQVREIKGSGIIVMTAGLARKPGMTREDLVNKNAQIMRDVCQNIKEISPQAILIVVSNPLDIMTYLALKITGFNPRRVFGMGASLDCARFANIISKGLNIPVLDIEACVIGSHGEGMLPLPRFTKIKGQPLDKVADAEKIEALVKETVARGAEIVSLLGSASAYFAPSAAIAEIVRAIVKDQKKALGVSSYLNGEYGCRDICVGVPCSLGSGGIEQIITLDLNNTEKEAFRRCAESIRNNLPSL